MSDILLDLDVLRSARSRVGDALATFESAERSAATSPR